MPMKLSRSDFRWSNGRGHDQKPLLYAQKDNRLGLGKKLNNFTDEWWTNAFDQQLKSLDVSSSSATGDVTVKQTSLSATPVGMGITARYYIKFVRGGLLDGGIEKSLVELQREETATPEGSESERRKGKKSKKEKKEREEKRKRKEEKRKKKDGRVEKKSGKESKEEKKARRRLAKLVEREMKALAVAA